MAHPIIFLDIHHVLTNDTSNFVYDDHDRMDPVSVRLLAKLAHRCDAAIVITSSVRLGRSERELSELLRSMGGKRLVKYLMGCINGPVVGPDNPIMRGQWVDEYINNLTYNAVPYVILDDKPHVFLPAQHVVPIDGAVGFRLSDYNAALAHLCPNDE